MIQNNQPCIARPTLIDLNSDEYHQELSYYPFMVKLYRCNASCNMFDNSSTRICVPNKTADVNLNVVNMITWINEFKKTFIMKMLM